MNIQKKKKKNYATPPPNYTTNDDTIKKKEQSSFVTVVFCFVLFGVFVLAQINFWCTVWIVNNVTTIGANKLFLNLNLEYWNL